MKTTYIGVDLGGTKLLIGEMDRQGNLLRSSRWPSGPMDQPQAVALIQRCLDEFLAQSTPDCQPAAIGVGLVGRIDNKTGIWYEISPAMAQETPLGQLLSRRYGLPCFVDNDVRSATKAELLFGAGQRSRDLIYLNVGTGIAAGFVTNGHLVTGGHHNAGEVGHTASGIGLKVPCPCGLPDCVEMVAAGVGIDASARLLAPQYPDTTLPIPETGRVKAEDVFARMDSDALCSVLVENAASAIANLIMNLIRFNDPDTIVLGGGMLANGVLYPRILEKLNPETIRFVSSGIVMTALDARYVGVLGACSNAVMGMEERL